MDKNKRSIYNKRYYEKSKIKKNQELQELQELQENYQTRENQELLMKLYEIIKLQQEQLKAHNSVISGLNDIIKQLISN